MTLRFLALLLLSLSASAVASPPALTWSPTDHSAQVAANGFTATRTGIPFGHNWDTIRSDTAQSTGIRYVEFHINEIGPNGISLGLANGVAATSNYLGSDTNGVSYWSIGNTRKNGTWGGVMPPSYTAGDTIGMMADLNAHTVKFNKNGGAFSGTLDITSLGQDVFVGVSLGGSATGQPASSITITADSWNDYQAPTLNIIGHGDSISLTSGVQRGYLPRLVDLIRQNRAGLATWARAGINGASWNFAWSQAGYPYTLTQDIAQRVVPVLSTSIPNWVIAWAGTNGFVLAGHSATTEYANLQADVNALIAAGVPANHIIVPTMLPRTGLSETTRTAYNAAIVADAGGIGYRVAHVDDPGITFIDGVHPTDAGHQIIAQIIYAVMF